jgi:hypothetical protein
MFFFGLQGFTRTAQGAMAVVGDSVRGASFAPPLDERSGFGLLSPTAREPARRNVEPGSLITELGCEGIDVRDARISLTVSTERPPLSDTGEPLDDRLVRDDDRIVIGWEGFSVEVSLVLASLSSIGPL